MKLFFGNSIKIYRKMNNLKQEDLAKIVGISQAMLGMIENNKRNASEYLEEKIKKEIGISLNKELQYTLLNNFEEYLINYFKNLEQSSGTALTIQFFQSTIAEFVRIPKLYYGRLMEKEFFEIDELKSFRNILIYEETKNYYYNVKDLKLFYKTYTEFILDNIENIIEIINNYISKNQKVQNLIVFKDKLPPNIKNDYEKIIKNINSTTYADYNSYIMNIFAFDSQIGFTITDDSMSPKYEINNIVIINITDKLENNKDYLIRINKEFIIRRIQLEDEQILLKPLNFNYDIKTYTKDNLNNLDIEIIGKVTDIKIN